MLPGSRDPNRCISRHHICPRSPGAVPGTGVACCAPRRALRLSRRVRIDFAGQWLVRVPEGMGRGREVETWSSRWCCSCHAMPPACRSAARFSTVAGIPWVAPPIPGPTSPLPSARRVPTWSGTRAEQEYEVMARATDRPVRDRGGERPATARSPRPSGPRCSSATAEHGRGLEDHFYLITDNLRLTGTTAAPGDDGAFREGIGPGRPAPPGRAPVARSGMTPAPRPATRPAPTATRGVGRLDRPGPARSA